jgi:hypothetical protein
MPYRGAEDIERHQERNAAAWRQVAGERRDADIGDHLDGERGPEHGAGIIAGDLQASSANATVIRPVDHAMTCAANR